MHGNSQSSLAELRHAPTAGPVHAWAATGIESEAGGCCKLPLLPGPWTTWHCIWGLVCIGSPANGFSLRQAPSLDEAFSPQQVQKDQALSAKNG